MRFKSVGFAITLVLVFAGAWAASAIPWTESAVEIAALEQPTLARYDSATMFFEGALTDTASALLGDGEFVLVVLQKPDVLACEDIGRQLREVAFGRRLPMKVAVDESSVAAVSRFLRRERLDAVIVPIAPEQIVETFSALPTPSVLLVTNRRIAAGVAHPARFANARVRSFHEELGRVTTGEEIGFRKPSQEHGS